MRSWNKLNSIYRHLQNTPEYKTRQGTDLPWDARTLQTICDKLEVACQSKKVKSISQNLWLLTQTRSWVTGCSGYKLVSRHWHLVLWVIVAFKLCLHSVFTNIPICVFSVFLLGMDYIQANRVRIWNSWVCRKILS